MAVNLSPVGGVAAQFFTNTGAVLTGGKLYTYAAGTTTPQTTFTSGAGTISWTNPIVLDAAGRVSGSGEIWLTDGISYKFVLKDSNDVLIATYDNITGINSNFVNFVAEQEIQTATAGQTVFTLTTTEYQPGTNTLSVFVDGVNQYGPGAQYAYTETSSTVVTFTNGLHVGAVVKFTTTQTLSGGVIDSSQVVYDPPFAGSTDTTVEAKLGQTVSVKDFGAVGDGVTDDTAAIQDALDYGTSVKGSVFFPSGTYIVSSTGLFAQGQLSLIGDSIKSAIVKNLNGNCLRVQGNQMNVSTMTFWSVSGGHTITQTDVVDQGTWNNVQLIQDAAGYSIWDNASEEFVDMRFRDCYFQHVLGATVPGFNLSANGGLINDNVWEKSRCQYSGNYFFNIESTTANFQFHNTFRDLTFEVCVGGGIQLTACYQAEITNCANWDAQSSGVITKNFYNLLGNGSSFPCVGVAIRGCGRWAGSNDTGVYDVSFPAGGLANGTIVENCNSAGSGSAAFSVDVHSGSAFIYPTSGNFSTTAALNAVTYGGSSILFGDVTVARQSANVLNVDEDLTVTGRLRVGPTISGAVNRIADDTSLDYVAYISNTSASSPFGGLSITYNNASPNGTANPFINAVDNLATRFVVRSNGGIANYSANNVNLSDRREKINFAPAPSYLSKICAIPVQTYNYVDQDLENDPGLTLGVVAQDVQAIAPELVTESNCGTEDSPKIRLSIYQTDLQYALMKCIQEQQEIIESLKARLDAANL